MSRELLIVVMASDGTFQVFRNDGASPVEVTAEYAVNLREDGSFEVRRVEVEVE